ncbi:lipopolysaccharide assembly protein, LptC-like family [Massilia sp. WF1]|uniref:LPS export ABC transporter periplasmic protein LptC n=1 Tax=unclassified Massilia TaxID=2609279 RepID=UPI000649D172|nr:MULTISPECIES: LPS export ABC transporter periplasmic protein LptC [unclassified Massilia]ALK95500.1 LPS export ABC transporter periplasmic protein LptC [Massilia sp. WG5]KLU34923.1 lipopolysaccharide assembly protein, LptC-like family [Massilia sp. WF1]
MATTTYVNKRTAHRWRLLALMLAALFFAFGSFWLVQVMRGGDDVHNVNVGNDPDYIIDNFSFVRMSETGQPRYVISGERLTHRPANNTSVIDKPVVQSLSVDHPHMTMTADTAHVNQDQNQIDLVGNVDITRPGSATTQPMRIRTEALTVLPDEEISKTDKPIQMTLGAASATGVGMVANNATQQLDLGGRGRIIYPPRSAR